MPASFITTVRSRRDADAPVDYVEDADPNGTSFIDWVGADDARLPFAQSIEHRGEGAHHVPSERPRDNRAVDEPTDEDRPERLADGRQQPLHAHRLGPQRCSISSATSAVPSPATRDNPMSTLYGWITKARRATTGAAGTEHQHRTARRDR